MCARLHASSGRVRCALLAALALAGLLPAGCGLFARREAHKPFRLHRRVVLVEFFDRSRYTGTGRTFTDQLRDQLAELSPDTDFVVVPQEAIRSLEDPFETGKIGLQVLVAARKSHRADAIILGRVEGHRPYRPPSVHVSIKVVDTARAVVLYEASAGWDARSRAVQRDIQSYYREYAGTDRVRFGPNIFTISPRYFLQYAANRAARRMAEAL